MSTGPDQSAELKFVVTNTLIVRDIKRSVAFYRDVLGATVLREGEPTFPRLGNIWLTINGGGGGTGDKPDVVAAPPGDPNVLSNFINLRVTNIKRRYQLWSTFKPYLAISEYDGLAAALLAGTRIGDLPAIVQPEPLRSGRLDFRP